MDPTAADGNARTDQICQADQAPRLDAQAGHSVVRRDEQCHPNEIARQQMPSRRHGIPPSSPFRLCTLPSAVHSPRLTTSFPWNITASTSRHPPISPVSCLSHAFTSDCHEDHITNFLVLHILEVKAVTVYHIYDYKPRRNRPPSSRRLGGSWPALTFAGHKACRRCPQRARITRRDKSPPRRNGLVTSSER